MELEQITREMINEKRDFFKTLNNDTRLEFIKKENKAIREITALGYNYLGYHSHYNNYVVCARDKNSSDIIYNLNSQSLLKELKERE